MDIQYIYPLKMETREYISINSPGKEVIVESLLSWCCATQWLSSEVGFLALSAFIFNVCSFKLL